jgi:hypothetical protein
VANAKYVTCDANGTWCYQHGGESNGKTFTNSRLACQALNGDLVWWCAAAGCFGTCLHPSTAARALAVLQLLAMLGQGWHQILPAWPHR